MTGAGRRAGWWAVLCALFPAVGAALPEAAAQTSAAEPGREQPSPLEVITQQQWSQIDRAVDGGLAYLAAMQRKDGSFPTLDSAQPAVTSLCVLAFLSRGHKPGEGRYGPVIDQAVGFVLTCQQPSGLLSHLPLAASVLQSNPSHTAQYNHAIAGVMLAEAYGMTTGTINQRIRAAIEAALAFTLKREPRPKRRPADEGGWRYGKAKPPPNDDSDLSVTSWQLMFLRSSRNAGFNVPANCVEEGVAYVRRCFDPRQGTFRYALNHERHVSRAMAGAGILSLSLGGQHQTEFAQRAGQWLLRHNFDRYNRLRITNDAYFYGVFYCTQAMFQLGGHYWAEFYPRILNTLTTHQRQDGSWEPGYWREEVYGSAYSTAMAVLAVGTPYQLLPIFQR